MWYALVGVVYMKVFFFCTSYISDNSELVVNDTVDGKDKMEKKTTEVTER